MFIARRARFMLRQVLVPNRENSTISIPTEYYGMEVEVVVYPTHPASDDKNLEAYNNLSKFRGTLNRDIDCRAEQNDYLDGRYGHTT
jgi:hypothetical protein